MFDSEPQSVTQEGSKVGMCVQSELPLKSSSSIIKYGIQPYFSELVIRCRHFHKLGARLCDLCLCMQASCKRHTQHSEMLT